MGHPEERAAGQSSELSAASLAQLTDAGTSFFPIDTADEVGSEMAPGAEDRTGALQLTASHTSRRSLPQGLAIGRFLVLDKLGEGGMGVVYAAYDPALNRRVAIKLLLVAEAESGSDARLRLLREAQALAQLSHPAVVAIYEVGEHDGDIFIAMEYVEGKTLRDWLRSDPQRSWRVVLDVCLEAGRGLAAAHAAGLVHRDFKPANVLVGDDGRVRVMDFGLARASSGGATDSGGAVVSGEASDISGVLLHSNVTHCGLVVGTPAYMAPEQLRGVEADVRSDQYSYCISLFEALYGHKPDPKNAAATAAPRGSKVPPWVHAVIMRGLAASPDARFSSMDELLRALAVAPSARRNKLLAIAGAALLPVGGAAGAVAWQQQQGNLCQGAAQKLVGIWDAEQRTRTEAAVIGVGAIYARDMWSLVEPALDTYAQRWVQQHQEACEATTLRGEQSTELLDLRMACLQRAQVKMKAVVDVLASADATVVQKAHELVKGLEPLERCADAEGLRAQVQPPLPEEVETVEQVHGLLARAMTLRQAGRFPEAKLALDEADSLLSTITYEPVRAEVLLERGGLHKAMGELEASERAFRDALESAAKWRQLNLVRGAATALLHVVGDMQRRPEEGLHYLELARGLTAGESDEARAALHNNLGNVFWAQKKFVEAEAEQRQALALRQQAPNPAPAELAASHDNLGITLWAQGKHAEAETEQRKALALWRKALGPDHPNVGHSLNNLANVLKAQGKYEEAEAEHRTALMLRTRSLGPKHPSVGDSHNNLASTLKARGKFEEAELEIRRALAVFEEALGREHPFVAEAHLRLGFVLASQGKHEEAQAEHEHALALGEETLGPDHALMADARSGLAQALAAQGEYTEAESHARRALTIKTGGLGPDHPQVDAARIDLAQILLLLGTSRASEALELAELGLPSNESSDAAYADAAFVLARALWQTKGDETRARTFAERAAQVYEQIGRPERRDEVRQWLRRHARRE